MKVMDQFIQSVVGLLRIDDVYEGSILACGLGERIEEFRALYPKVIFQQMDLSELCSFVGSSQPLAGKPFDFIILGRCFEFVDEPKRLADYLYMQLRETGSLLALFGNIHHWSVGKEWWSGHWRYLIEDDAVLLKGVKRWFALPEIVQMFQDACYEYVEIDQILMPCQDDFVRRATAAGVFNEHDDLETKFWVIRANYMRGETAWLRQFYSPAVRRQLVYILRRIENDIAVADNVRILMQLCRREKIPKMYIERLARNSMLRPKKVQQVLDQVVWGEPYEEA